MPSVKVNGINLFYESFGTGEPLVFISGLGGTRQLWALQLEFFARHYRVIIFDNRGAGDTDRPTEPYSTFQMAKDLKELLDFLKINEPVNLVGASMGGLIAQAFIHNYPEKVKKLVLACTGPSLYDPRFTKADEDVIQKIFYPAKTPEEKVENLLSVMYHPQFVKTNPQIKTYLLQRDVNPQPDYAYRNQLAACSEDLPYYQWLSEIKVPVMVIHGRQDRVWPLKNAEVLKEGLGKNGKLVIIDGTGHIFFQEKPAEFNQELLNFLQKG